MSQSRWENKTDLEIRKYLLSILKGGIELMLKRLKKEEYEVKEIELWKDLDKV